jgi:SAM-dependent methyltransferase
MRISMTDDYSVYAQFYDLDHSGLDADLMMIEQIASLCGSPILELACGTGRALLPLARQGHQVTGVDISPKMLAIARGKFNLAFVALNSFMHLLTPEDQLESLQRIHQHLNPGGRLLLDLFNPDLGRLLDFRGQVSLDKVMIDPETGHRLMKFRTEKVEPSQQTIYVMYMIDDVDDQGVVRRTLVPFSLRYLFRAELEHLLQRAGFAVEAIYGSYDLDDFNSDSDKMIAIARRPD